jgi:2-polyprenyl-6-methoxyphenol hydroxylase-like FAD-dependent oxidoreductase
VVELDLLERVVECSGRSHHFLVRAGAGKMLMDIALGKFETPALCTRRSDPLAALISVMRPERVRRGHEFERFERQRHGVKIHFAGGITKEHDVMIGADGIRSRVRCCYY